MFALLHSIKDGQHRIKVEQYSRKSVLQAYCWIAYIKIPSRFRSKQQ